ncbi:MAG: prepilin-type N-terminal cleavage/methylation domain-containing protein [Phycisphaerales bacterium JB039]
MQSTRLRRPAFTVLEMLIVTVIIAILAALALPLLAGMRDSGRAASCLSNVRQIGVVTYAIVAERRDMWPFWIANYPASPPVRREGLSDVYSAHIDTLEIFRCPADPTSRRALVADYTSYYYWPGAEMQDELHKGAARAIREVSAIMNLANRGMFLWDRRNWHGGGTVSHASYVPDGHAGVK